MIIGWCFGEKSEKIWCTLFGTVVLNFDEKLRMAEILTGIMRPKNIICSKAFSFFHHLYNFSQNYCKENFLRIREGSMEMLVCLYVSHLKEKQKEMDKYVIIASKSNHSISYLRNIFLELSSFLSKLSPCEAIYVSLFFSIYSLNYILQFLNFFSFLSSLFLFNYFQLFSIIFNYF